MRWQGLPPPQPPAAAAGFLLPLASGAALVLLLTGLSLQAAVLHQRELAAEALRQRQEEDALASAAQRLVAQLDGPYRCLQALPLPQWSAAAPACAAPITAAQLAALQEPREAGLPLRLLAWEPGAQTTVLRLGVIPQRAGGPAAQRRFHVAFGGQGQVRSLREVGP
jgi:hypothetical protein